MATASTKKGFEDSYHPAVTVAGSIRSLGLVT